jgi:methionine synthase II (cobalamin-independent)
VTGPLHLSGRVHATEARLARAHTSRALKFTLPGPMTLVDTIADRHYGDKVALAMALADLLNQEARALEQDGVDTIQFDEPAFNVYMDEVATRMAAIRTDISGAGGQFDRSGLTGVPQREGAAAPAAVARRQGRAGRGDRCRNE